MGDPKIVTARLIVSENGIRWCSNILTEILANHVDPSFPEAAIELRIAVMALYKAQTLLRSEEKDLV